ncbi:MAG: N-acetylglucosamine-6-phosphate deacetylase [Streptococcaceae bacterium]|jgi:N-acetylglucosamine-6-phosphate deacetylase|nr:N-acetylglucosamine-6-phosphate deacetylase [Streptococcaceae bacterium]
MKRYILADQFFYANSTKDRGYLEIQDDKFGRFYEKLPEISAKVIDYSGKFIAPGFVDTHIHGFNGVDVMDNNWEGVIKTMSEGLLSCGVTSFLPTTLTASKKLLAKVARGIGEHYRKATGAKIQGLYFEGPYFTKEYKGAQNPLYIRDPNIDEFHSWQSSAGGLIKKIAIAPESFGVYDFVQQVVEEGVVVALGHSSATFAKAREAVDAGASVWTHAYNGMREFTHHEPGMVGAMMSQKHMYAELICDGHHVHQSAAQILLDAVGRDHVALITDCMRAGGMPDGYYPLGEFEVEVRKGTARLSSGNLAGSALKLKDAVKNVIDWGIATHKDAVMMASLIPAISCKINDCCGSIRLGQAADFVVLNPDMTLLATYLNGKLRYKS